MAYKWVGKRIISGWAYIRNNIPVGKWMALYPGWLKTGRGGGGALTWDFTVLQVSKNISKGIGILTTIHHYTNIHILTQLIFPFLAYAVVVWGNTYSSLL